MNIQSVCGAKRTRDTHNTQSHPNTCSTEQPVHTDEAIHTRMSAMRLPHGTVGRGTQVAVVHTAFWHSAFQAVMHTTHVHVPTVWQAHVTH